MSLVIDWKNKTILQCSNGIISALNDALLDLIYEENLSFNKDIEKLINRLETASRGIGFDLADYLHTQEDLKIFKDLVKKGIDRLHQEIPPLPPTTTERLESFYKGLVEACKTFPN